MKQPEISISMMIMIIIHRWSASWVAWDSIPLPCSSSTKAVGTKKMKLNSQGDPGDNRGLAKTAYPSQEPKLSVRGAEIFIWMKMDENGSSSSITIHFRPFSSMTIHLHPSPSIFIHHHPFSSITIPSSTSPSSIIIHPFSSIYIHFHPHTSITVHFHPS